MLCHPLSLTVGQQGSSFPRSSSVEANIYPAWWGYLEPEETEKDKKKLTGKV